MMKKIAIGLLTGMLIGGAITAFASSIFPDITGNEWFAKHIASVAKKGIINGYPDKTFKPGNQVNRAELATIVDQAINYEHARQLAFAFLDWSYGQKKDGPQEVSINEKKIITSGSNAGGRSIPALDNNAIEVLMDLISEKTGDFSEDQSFYDCLDELKKAAVLNRCGIFGKIKTIDTETGVE